MTPQTLTTAADYNNAPLGSVIIDEDGCAWQKVTESTNIIDGYIGSWQRATDATTLDGLAMTEGQPSTVIYTPDPTEPPHPHNYQTAQDPEELDHLPVGTVVKDKEGDCYARVDNGWIWTEQTFNSLDSFYGPYTVIRTPSQCETPATCEDH